MGENGQSNRDCGEEQSQDDSLSTSSQQKQPDSQTTTNRFADYFVICGLDLDTGLEADRFAGMYITHSVFRN